MLTTAANKNLLSSLVAAFLAISALGCDKQKTTQSNLLNNREPAVVAGSGATDNRADRRSIDLGEDWDAEIERDRARTDRTARGGRLVMPDHADEPSGGPIWSIILGTYTGPGHAASARRMLSELPRVSPVLTSARVHQTDDGSMVVYGRYDGPDDERAQDDLREIKSIKINDRPVFPRAFLSRISSGADARSPYALMNVRRQYPNTDPLYTLQVAVWGDFGSGQLPREEIRRQAEAYVLELRAQGHEAYVHHSKAQTLSIVTIGLFDHRAFDAKAGIDSPELRRVKEQFPVHLVNGEELNEPIDPRRPAAGTRVQTPRLVKVPLP